MHNTKGKISAMFTQHRKEWTAKKILIIVAGRAPTCNNDALPSNTLPEA